MSNWLPWLLLILVLIILALVIWWWWKRRTTVAAPAPIVPVAPAPTRAAPAAPASVKPDDLTVIEGIGPKIAGVLNKAGITTFAQLAATDTGTLQGLLRTEGLQFADPTTWPQQAKLAAEGKMDELKALQDSLKGGRRA